MATPTRASATCISVRTGEATRARTAALQVSYEQVQARTQIRLLTQAQKVDRLREQRTAAGLAGLALVVLGLAVGGRWQYRSTRPVARPACAADWLPTCTTTWARC